MSADDRKLGRKAVVDDRDASNIRVYPAGTPAAEIDPEFLETLGDHVWATDDDGKKVGGLDQLKAASGSPQIHVGGGDPVPVAGEPVPTAPPAAGEATAESLSDLTKDELRDLCKARDLPVSGTVPELIARLLDGDTAEPEPEPEPEPQPDDDQG